MMMQGLSDSTVSKLVRIRLSGAQDSTDLALMTSAWLDKQEEKARSKDTLELVKRLQLFSNPDLYREIYRDEIKQAKDEKLKSIAPEDIDLDKVNELLKNFKIA